MGRAHRTASTLVGLLLVAAGHAATHPPSDDNVVETFTPPERIKTTNPLYPRTRQYQGGEGWVALNFMIDTEGVPYDITVNTSSGDSAFERAAIRAVEEWRYQPAMFQGQPIDAGTLANITFLLSGGSGATPFFARYWKRYQKAEAAGDTETMAKALTKIEEHNRNIYEEAFYQLLLSRRHQTSGDVEAEYIAVTRAAFLDHDKGYLPEAALTGVLLRKMNLELELNKLAQARKTISALRRRELDEDLDGRLADIAAAIETAATAEGVIKSTGRIRSDNQYVHSLLKSSFALADIDGDIAEARLHCDKGYVGFAYRDDMQYRVKADWSNCTLILIGDPATTFVLIEN